MSENAVQTLPITKHEVDALAARRQVLRDYVSSQMVEGVDFGTIPGTPKPTLYKPGAEKLSQLFGFAARIVHRDKEIDLHHNFAMFSYTYEIYHVATNRVVAQCEGSTNSHEKKWKMRGNQETPIGDLMNTLMKMAQKRAYVGAVIQATGASDFYTQDLDSVEDAESAGVKAPPRTVKASVPGVKSARATDESQAPICCDRPMMVSKFEKDTWYCPNCKNKKAMGTS